MPSAYKKAAHDPVGNVGRLRCIVPLCYSEVVSFSVSEGVALLLSPSVVSEDED